MQHIGQPLRLLVGNIENAAGRQTRLTAGEIHRMHHVEHKGKVQISRTAARQTQQAFIALQLRQYPGHNHPVMRAEQAARAQDQVGGLRIIRQQRRNTLLGSKLAGGIVIGKAGGNIRFGHVVTMAEIEINRRRRNMNEPLHCATSGGMGQFFRHAGIGLIKCLAAPPGRRFCGAVPDNIVARH
ncbi:hypothetical protein D3C71_1524920 [compost metagenome]